MSDVSQKGQPDWRAAPQRQARPAWWGPSRSGGNSHRI